MSDLSRKTVENCSHIKPSTERGWSCVGQIYISCPTALWRLLNFTLTWRRESTAECSYDTRTSQGCSTGRPWTSANFPSLRRPSYAGMVCNAHFKPVLGKWYNMHRGHTMKTLTLINPFYEELENKQTCDVHWPATLAGHFQKILINIQGICLNRDWVKNDLSRNILHI